MNLSNEEKRFLLELQGNPIWGEILRKLKFTYKYKPKRQPDEKIFHEFVYNSGRLKENDLLLNLLTGEKDVSDQ